MRHYGLLIGPSGAALAIPSRFLASINGAAVKQHHVSEINVQRQEPQPVPFSQGMVGALVLWPKRRFSYACVRWLSGATAPGVWNCCPRPGNLTAVVRGLSGGATECET